jgi:hypothetical protein
MVRRAACDKGNGLNRLDRRSRRSSKAVVAEAGYDMPVGLKGDYGPPMPRFNYRASSDFNQYRKLIVHLILTLQDEIGKNKSRG